jgi:hypothetical protein
LVGAHTLLISMVANFWLGETKNHCMRTAHQCRYPHEQLS